MIFQNVASYLQLWIDDLLSMSNLNWRWFITFRLKFLLWRQWFISFRLNSSFRIFYRRHHKFVCLLCLSRRWRSVCLWSRDIFPALSYQIKIFTGHWTVTWITQWIPHVDQKLFTLPDFTLDFECGPSASPLIFCE